MAFEESEITKQSYLTFDFNEIKILSKSNIDEKGG